MNLFGFTAQHFPTVIERYIVRFHPYHLPDGSVHDVCVVLSYHTIFGIEGWGANGDLKETTSAAPFD